MDTKSKIKEVLEKGFLVSLATSDEAGVWVADLIYVNDDNLNIYWMSDPDVRHSQALTKNNQVSGSITVTCYGEKPELGIQFSGIAEKVEGSRYDLVMKHFEKRQKSVPNEDEDVLQGDSWYMLKPSKIDLIDVENYGFNKQRIEL